MAEQNIPQDGEVDLGSLFKVIGKGFQNLFSAIGRFFKAIFHFFILLLLFLRNNALKLGIAIFVGAAMGLYLDLTLPKQYSSTMIVEPNFKSAQQLYKNINFYHELVKQKDSNLLALTFNISVQEAAKLKGFYIEAIRNENEKYQFFNNFIQEIDTTTVRNINIKEFKKGFTDYNYSYHEIKVKSLSNAIFEKLSLPIINSIENNPYYKYQKKINDENLLQNEKVLIKSLQEVDTLRRIYNEVLITEANKEVSSTNITLAQGARKTNEIQLFNESLELNEELIENNKEKAETTEILNVVSTFSRVGVKESDILKKKTVILGVALGLIMLAFILFRQLNSYLINYRNN
jgi:predicted transcriptional regulator